MKVYTQATFDLFHSGHVRLLAKCHKLAQGGKVVVSLLSDEAISKYRGHPPVMSFKERKEVVEACRYVDRVIKGDNTKTELELRQVVPDIVVLGSDWAKKDIYSQYGIKDREWLDSLLVYVPYTEGISTTEIKERIKNG